MPEYNSLATDTLEDSEDIKEAILSSALTLGFFI